ncbi:hypothetical protein [Rufibacter sp. LB8]|uniref:hypothetical protein n=1 Tax=Rufibacter sp. LB8 TaxID=2777781 RepID=UPI00178C595D|nr:hypothetical protein [Rufibacter sp. LB8]
METQLDSSNYSDTPIYKIWVDIIELMIPRFSAWLVNHSFRSQEVVLNRSGVHIYHQKGEIILEIYYSQPNKNLYCLLRDNKTEEIVPWSGESFPLKTVLAINNRNDLFKAVEELEVFLKNQFE